MVRMFWIPLAVILAGCSQAPTDSQQTGNIVPKTAVASSAKLLAQGKTVFERNCSPCHGLKGDGQGPAAYLLYPKPRDLVGARYRLISTWDFAPLDEDIFQTISRGMPGSAMPSWAHLAEGTRWALVHYVKTFARNPFQFQADHQPQNIADSGRGKVVVPPEVPYTAESEANARRAFEANCADCHGKTGKGDGQKVQEDSEGFPTRPRDLTAGIYKGRPDAPEVYKRIAAGLPGSPMPSFPQLYGKTAWDLAHFVRSLSSDAQRARMEMKRFRIIATRVNKLPAHPDDSVWRSTPATELHLMPLWWREQRAETLTVRALHDGNEIAIQQSWADPTYDHTAIRPQDFRDGTAIEFAVDSQDPPFFGMGEGTHAGKVNIWMWKSERQADMEPAFQELDKVYPNIGIDSYPNLLRSPLEQPTRNALTLESDPRFVTGWGAGNIVSDPTRKSAAEDLGATGFGTLKAHPMKGGQHVAATGVHDTGSYRVVFRRKLKVSGDGDVALQPGSIHPVAFAVWDGSARDRDGMKSITIWQELFIGK